MAGVHAKFASLRTQKIGSIYHSPNGFKIGPDVETGEGPFGTPKPYYQAVARQQDKRCGAHSPDESDRPLDSADVPAIFSMCINSIPDDHVEDDFGLANRDLGPHNLLVDENFKIVGTIDLDFVLSAPLHVVASPPHRTYSMLDINSSDLGVRQRTIEYINALSEAGRPEFPQLMQSPLAVLWADLEAQDHGGDSRDDLIRKSVRCAVEGISFIGEDGGKSSEMCCAGTEDEDSDAQRRAH
ncbi:MAG: hypothetical protein Q9164_007547 [Protoblastenia rupestris]